MLGEFTKREFRILLVNMKLSCKKAVALLGLAAFAQNKGCIVICDLQGINPIVFLGPTNHEENGREGPKHAPTDETNGGINDVGPPDVRRSVDSTSDKLRGTAWHSRMNFWPGSSWKDQDETSVWRFRKDLFQTS